MKKYIFFTIALYMINCSKNNSKNKIEINNYYIQKIENERKERDERRVKYLKISGLFKLNNTNYLNFDQNDKLYVSNSKLNTTIGEIEIKKKEVKFISKSDGIITNKKNNIIKLKKLELNKIGDSEMLFYKNFSWRIITRSNELYIRIWDEDNPAVKEFQSFENYEINPNLIFNANFKYYKSSQFKTVDSKLGIKDITNFIGEIEFEYLGKNYFLEVGENGWIMVGDYTNGDTTYGSGRYLYIDLPEKDGKCLIDFNYLYNPPCSYSDYTTCLFPSLKNRLPIKIEAGELFKFKN